MFGIASKKDLEDLRYRMQIAMRDDRTTVALRHSGIDSRAFASCRRQVDIIAEVEALRAELDALRKRETKTQNGLEGVATHSSLNYRCNRDRLDTVEGKLGLLLEHLGLEATWAEAAWELREVEK